MTRRNSTTGPYVIDNLDGRSFPALGVAISYAQTRVAVADVPLVRIKHNDVEVARVWRDEDRAVLTTVKEEIR